MSTNSYGKVKERMMRYHKEKFHGNSKEICKVEREVVGEKKDKRQIIEQPKAKKNPTAPGRFDFVVPLQIYADKCRRGENSNGEAKAKRRYCRKVLNENEDCVCTNEMTCGWSSLEYVTKIVFVMFELINRYGSQKWVLTLDLFFERG